MKDIGTCAADRDPLMAVDYAAWVMPETVDPTIFQSLFDAAMASDKSACEAAIATALENGIAAEDLADIYIPALAHQIGRGWCEDNVSFAQATIGSARLQMMLRDLSPAQCADQSADPDAPLLLLLSLKDAHHTLGSVVLAGQLRRRGYSVRIIMGACPDDLTETLQTLSFDAVFISASEHEELEDLRRMVTNLRALSARRLPIAIGGGLLRVQKNVASLVGVDIATSNIDEAIVHCDLANRPKSSVFSANRI